MTTNNSIDTSLPIPIVTGGINSSSLSTSYGVMYYDSSSLVTVPSVGTSGYVLKSNGVGVAPSFQAPGSGSGSVATAFFANRSSDVSNVTGDGTSYVVVWNNEVYDIGSDFNTSTGVFTAPSTSKYFLVAGISMSVPEATKVNAIAYDYIIITTSTSFAHAGNPSYEVDHEVTSAFYDTYGLPISVLTAMDAADTAHTQITTYDSIKDNSVKANTGSYFCGYEPN